jgi:hypothetical protein
MAKDKLEELAEIVKAGFASVDTRFATLETRVERNFAR